MLQQLAGGDGDLHGVAGDAGGISAGAQLRAAAGERFELPVVQRRTGHRHVIAGVAVLAVGENLDDLIARQFVGDSGEVERVAASRVISGKRQRADGIEQVAAGAVNVVGLKRDGDGHSDP
jgi:hypothetical protein